MGIKLGSSINRLTLGNIGFTIIECLISLLILAILMTGGMAFYQYSNDLMKAATHKRIAVEIANAKMEDIKKNGFGSLPSIDGLWQTNPITIAGLSGQQNVYVYDVSNYKRVAVENTWLEPGKTGNQVVKLETYIAP